MLSLQQVKAGAYILGSQRAEQQVNFGVLIVNPAGQWYLKFRTFDDANIDNKMRQIFISIACRLGLMPVHLVEKFETALLSPEPICLVADTSSLFNGSFEQAVRLRAGKPTHLAVPDQVYMEIQRQRERASIYSKKTDHKMLDWLAELRFQRLQVASTRVLRRLKENAGMIIHFIRPPQPLVRYFGSERGSSSSEEIASRVEDGLAYHRDRLILEAAINQKVMFPHIPVWLVTGDTKLAIQADLEDFKVGYSWSPEIPKVRLIGSPYIEPRTLTAYHLPVETFLEEWLWNWKKMTLQLSGAAEQQVWTLPSKERERARLELNDLSLVKSEIRQCKRCTVQQVLNPEETGVSLPQRAPPPHHLIEGLQIIAGTLTKDDSSQISSDVRAYLQALGWIERKNNVLEVTSRGQKWLTGWKQLTVETVIEWYEWCRHASQDILKLQPQRQIQDVLTSSQGDDKLAKQLGFSLKMMRTQLLLANAFGLLVRLNGKSWRTEWKPLPETAALILNTALRLQASSRGVRVDKIFTTLLNTTPLSLPNFRAGVFKLIKQGQIEVGGTVPDREGGSNIKIKILLPSEDGVQHPVIDLGAGGNLIPGKSCQVIIPVENAA